jgi:DSF synthase
MLAIEHSSRIETQVRTAPSQRTVVRGYMLQSPRDALWVEIDNRNFSIPLLTAMRSMLDGLVQMDMLWTQDGVARDVNYVVLKSRDPQYFNLGGDLQYFHDCIQRGAQEDLRRYSMLCLDMVYEWATRLNQSATTISLVQGRALGGGFEAAMSSDFLIAEDGAQFGFPEIMFGTFPCTGAMSLLCRRVTPRIAERIMTDGRVYTAAEMYELGVVDVVCAMGEGEEAVADFIRKHSEKREARMAVQRARHRENRLDYDNLVAVVEDWVRVASNLSPRELRAMEMLARMQRTLA